jgi:hypothetical protein
MMSGTGRMEVKMNPTPQFITHHFNRWQFRRNFDVDAARCWVKKKKVSSPCKSKVCVYQEGNCGEWMNETMQFERGVDALVSSKWTSLSWETRSVVAPDINWVITGLNRLGDFVIHDAYIERAVMDNDGVRIKIRR